MAETIGSLIDKISIINLKISHMREQTKRRDSAPRHLKNCSSKLKILDIQRKDLAEEMDRLFADVMNGRQKMKIYSQFKMYNDASYR